MNKTILTSLFVFLVLYWTAVHSVTALQMSPEKKRFNVITRDPETPYTGEPITLDNKDTELDELSLSKNASLKNVFHTISTVTPFEIELSRSIIDELNVKLFNVPWVGFLAFIINYYTLEVAFRGTVSAESPKDDSIFAKVKDFIKKYFLFGFFAVLPLLLVLIIILISKRI